MDLSIIILNYKQKGLVRQSLKNLKALDLPMEHEIIVVDNNSEDGIEQMIQSDFMTVKLVKAEKNRGYGAGNNLGLQKAKGRYILILNPDVTVLSDAIKKMFDFLESQPEAGIVGPKVLNPDGSLQYTCSRFPDWKLPFYRRTFLSDSKAGIKWTEKYLMMDWDHSYSRKVDWLFGACLMIRASAYEEVGGFDERFFLYMEDLDLCRRFWQKNWQVWYLTEAEVIHFHQRLSAENGLLTSLFSKSARIHLASWVKYFLKYRNIKS